MEGLKSSLPQEKVAREPPVAYGAHLREETRLYTWSEMPDSLPTQARRHWVMFVIPSLVATLVFYLGHQVAAGVIFVVGLSIGVGTLASPGFARTFERMASFLSLSFGTILRWLLLAPFYIVLMAPMAFINRLSGNDPLQLELDKTSETYWSTPPKSSGYDRPY